MYYTVRVFGHSFADTFFWKASVTFVFYRRSSVQANESLVENLDERNGRPSSGFLPQDETKWDSCQHLPALCMDATEFSISPCFCGLCKVTFVWGYVDSTVFDPFDIIKGREGSSQTETWFYYGHVKVGCVKGNQLLQQSSTFLPSQLMNYITMLW